MKRLEEIDYPLDPLKRVIRDFLHVEWYEADALREKIKSRSIGADANLLRSQLDELLQAEQLPIDQLNALTANEFETTEDARNWLINVYRQIFPDENPVAHKPNSN